MSRIAHVRYQTITRVWEQLLPVAAVIDTPDLHNVKSDSGTAKTLRRRLPKNEFGKSPGDRKWLMSRRYFRQVSPQGVKFHSLNVQVIKGPKSHNKIKKAIRPIREGNRNSPDREIYVEVNGWTRAQRFLIVAGRKRLKETRRHHEFPVSFRGTEFTFEVPNNARSGELVIARNNAVHKVGLGGSLSGIVQLVSAENADGVIRYTYRIV